MYSTPGPVPPGAPTARFAVALTTVMVGAVMLTPAIGVLGPFLVVELGMTSSQLGLLASIVPLSGAVLAPLAGNQVDRFGGRRLAVVLLVAAALGLLVFAAAPMLPMLMAAAIISGLALSIGNSSTNALIATHIPQGRQATVVGVKQSGVQLAAVIVGATVPSLAVAFGWRWATASLILVVALMLACVVAWVPSDGPIAPRPPSTTRGRDQSAAHREWMPARWLAAYAFILGAGSVGVVTYLPLYAVQRGGMTVTMAGALASVMAVVASVARIGWARLAERRSDTPTVLLLLAGLSTIAHLLALRSDGLPGLLWVATVGLGMSAVAWNGVAMLHIVLWAPSRLSGRCTGRVQVAFSLGMFVSPLIFGVLLDRTGTWTAAWAAMAVLSAVSGIVIAVGRRALLAPDVAAPDVAAEI